MENLPAEEDEIIIKCSLEEMTKAFFKDYEIIWHDPHVNSEENQQYLAQLEKLCKIQTFTDWKEAEDYIKAAKTVCHVITSGTNGELFVKEIFSSQNVPKIFTFCRNEDYHSAWAKNYEKVLCTETKIEDVVAQIQKNLLEWQKQTSSLKFDLPAFAPIFDDSDKSQMNHLHLYLKVIPRFKNCAQARNDLINLSREVYSDRKNKKLIADFEQAYNKYDKEVILKWYTQQSFLYKVINNCLRIATSDSIQWSRFLLKEIETAIKDQYRARTKNFSGLLYRAAYLSEKEWSSLKANVNREIEMHGFLSVSKEKSVALKFMGLDPTQKVFITIILPECPTEEGQGFAEIERFSRFPKEKEVLFNVRSRFLVLETEDEYSKDSPYRHLVLFYGAQGLRKFITEKDPKQQVSIQGIGKILCSRCQLPAGQMPEKLLFMSFRNLEKQIYFCKNCLEERYAPFLCIPATEKMYRTQIKGCFLLSPSQMKIPFYGYQCSQCGIKNQKRYFVCTDCGERERKWCQNCSNETLSCMEKGHAVILESYPFSFWCEKMSENELNHLKFQNNLVTDSNHVFQQAEMFEQTQDYEKAIGYYNVYMKQNEARGEDAKFVSLYSRLGLVYNKLGEYDKALEYHLKSLDIKKLAHGENHPDIALSYNNIASVYKKQGKYKMALEYHLKSLGIKKLVHGENHPDVAISYNNIALVFQQQGEYKMALEYHLKSLEIKELVNGENHPETAISYNNIGLVCDSLGEYKMALKYHLKSLDIYKSIYGEMHPKVATSYNNIGLAYNKQGEYQMALEYHLKSLRVFKSVHGESHPDIATLYNSIGLAYTRLGECNKALEYYFKALEIKRLAHGENHPEIAGLYNNIGSVFNKQGEYKKALEYHLESLDRYKSIHKENHPTIASLYNNIGLVHDGLGEYKTALEYYFKSLDIRKSVLRERHPSVATSFQNIASTYDKKGEYTHALEYYLKSLDVNKSIHGETHPDIAASYDKIGSVYEKQEEYKRALEYYLKSLEVNKSIHGEEDGSLTATLREKISKVESLTENKTEIHDVSMP